MVEVIQTSAEKKIPRKVRVGRVVSDKMDKTVVVAVESLRRHTLYKRTLRRVRKFMAHDAENSCRTGDLVRIRETRPLSRHKRWRVIEVLDRAGERRRGVSLPGQAAIVVSEEVAAVAEAPEAVLFARTSVESPAVEEAPAAEAARTRGTAEEAGGGESEGTGDKS